LATDELEELFFASRTDGFLGSLGRHPKPTFTTVRAAGMRDTFFALDLSKPDFPCRHEQTFEVGFDDGSVLWNPSTCTSRGFHVKIPRPHAKTVWVVVHGIASRGADAVVS
jgi:hypothetical protein